MCQCKKKDFKGVVCISENKLVINSSVSLPVLDLCHVRSKVHEAMLLECSEFLASRANPPSCANKPVFLKMSVST